MRIAVAGGTGVIGSLVVAAVSAAGHEPVVLARHAGVDLVAGTSLDAALDGASAVIDTTNVNTMKARASIAFFEAVTTNLLAAGARAGVGHHVALSIVGCDRVNLGYYVGKRRQEELVLADTARGSVLRATQVHEFAAQMLDRYGRLVLLPKMRSQPIAGAELASALVDLAVGPPVGLAPDLAGPQPLELRDMVRDLIRALGGRQHVVPIFLPGATGRAMAGGGLLPQRPGPRGQQTYAEWLVGKAAATRR